jgi:hypothetical protein
LIIKKNTKGLLFTLPFLIILPLVQKQWFNLYLFNINDFSFYSVLYYLSGIICPSLVCFNSISNNTYYVFNKNEIYSEKLIKGKSLLFLVVINLISLSYLAIDYAYINFDLICNLFFEGFNLQKPDIFQLSFLVLFVSILLIFKKSRILFKKLILGNFILVSFYIWYLQINNINVDDQFHIYRYFGLNNLNLINVLILVAVEICYLTWSFISYKTNLSDWKVSKPQKGDINPFLNMFIFYFFIIIYYSILT